MTLLYKLHRDWQLRGTYGRGFRAPQAFNEDLHISSVGGEPQFVLLSEGLTNETSDAYTLSLDYSHLFGRWQTKLAIDGFYNRLNNPFTLVSTGAILPNGSIVEEVRNGNGAYVAGLNFEASASPSAHWYFQIGGTVQEARYLEDQIIFEGEEGTEVAIDEFIRNPNLYGFISSTYRSDHDWKVDVTGTYTGSMIVPRVVGANGEISLIDSETFLDLNVKWSYQWKLSNDFSLQFMTGVQNILDSFQSEFDQGPMRDADFVYGPLRPRTFFIGVKLGNFYE
jgi:outer membrane receptor for ferrienterochelin and colicins